ncbi:MAG TPA: hypothetical protein VGO86_03085 [Candidatus Dormibacteraeota bacterium]
MITLAADMYDAASVVRMPTRPPAAARPVPVALPATWPAKSRIGRAIPQCRRATAAAPGSGSAGAHAHE